ncbi:hypothetical protein [Vibrio cholerae]|uniref:hypothetical protein n=1 Tax=Vibrio cholerae TaxID=666 RepID=UPI0011F387AD|nr:hypothetical protein [Vibrio cholerae]KAA1203505.1 hypothetical protein F0M20_16005 [Vibrio cholerae]GIA50481.1 hypothetical protein VCSRO39_2237 [Vibrio cholerae]
MEQKQWVMHTAIPNLRDKEWRKNVECTNEKHFPLRYVLKKYDMPYKFNGTEATLVFGEGNFYHHKKILAGKKVRYYINIDLVKEVVGEDKSDIDGYTLELVAFGFFDKTIRKSLQETGRRLFQASAETFSHDVKTLKQFNKVYFNES